MDIEGQISYVRWKIVLFIGKHYPSDVVEMQRSILKSLLELKEIKENAEK